MFMYLYIFFSYFFVYSLIFFFFFFQAEDGIRDKLVTGVQTCALPIYPDSFQKPNPFQPEVAVSIDSVIETKLDALGVIVSQFYEGGANGSADLLSSDPEKQKQRHRQVRDGFANRNESIANRFRVKLEESYGKDRAARIKYAEAFEICEYGRRPDKAELARLFPFFAD